MYYMKLNDNISPLVTILFKIFFDIKVFMFALIIIIFQVASAFYLMGRNQLHFDEILESDGEPLYASKRGALEFAYYLSLGEF